MFVTLYMLKIIYHTLSHLITESKFEQWFSRTHLFEIIYVVHLLNAGNEEAQEVKINTSTLLYACQQ